MLSAVIILNLFLTTAFATRTSSTTRTCRGEMQVTVALAQVSCGTEISIVQEGVLEVIPLEMC